jgi:hypothetical protein
MAFCFDDLRAVCLQRGETAMMRACKAGQAHIAQWLLSTMGRAALRIVKVRFARVWNHVLFKLARVFAEGRQPTGGRGRCQAVEHVRVAHRRRRHGLGTVYSVVTTDVSHKCFLLFFIKVDGVSGIYCVWQNLEVPELLSLPQLVPLVPFYLCAVPFTPVHAFLHTRWWFWAAAMPGQAQLKVAAEARVGTRLRRARQR